jgi:type II/III secretion system protein
MEPRVHHNKEVTLKLTVEVSNLNGSVAGSQGTSQPIISTRTISSTIRLKDGETNFLAGLIRRDKQNGSSGVPFLSDIPILGRVFSNKTHDEQSTDLVMTITPHIIRVPDINAEDLTPIYVGTENNVSYQGAPRVESINDNRSPFEAEQNRRRNQRAVAPTTAPRPQAPAGINLNPPAFPTSPFSSPRPFSTTPPPSPVAPQPPPQGASSLTPPGTNPSAVTAAADPAAVAPAAEPAAAENAGIVAPAAELSAALSPSIEAGTKFSFDPPTVSLSPGEETTVTLVASGAEGLADSKLGLDFDPAVLQVARIDPLNGGSVEPVSSTRLALTMPTASGGISGSRAIARLTIRGVAKGAGSVSLDATAMTLSSGGPAIVSSSPAQVEVK